MNRETRQIESPSKLLGSEAPSRARQVLCDGDILVSTVRPNLNTVAMVPQELNGATASTGFCVLRCRSDCTDPRFVYHWVSGPAFVAQMIRQATGASYPAVSDAIIPRPLIPLPSLEEQRRIAAILDQAYALRTKRRAALAKLDFLAQSVFLEMFDHPAKNSKD